MEKLPRYINRRLYKELGFTYKHILGYFTFPLLYDDMVNIFPSGSTFIEIGVFEGRSFAYLIKKIIESKKNINLIGVDHFEGMSKGLLNKVHENLALVKGKYEIIPKSSVEASKSFKNKSVEFVFIDAGHTYEDIKSDILAWMPKVKKGGIIGGHDYFYDDNSIKRAVDEIFGNRVDLKYKDENCWIVKM
jgi:hypothetical protein